MGFMHAYKKLDSLCRDMNGIGVTGYIEDMEHTPNGIGLVPGWKNDYLELKHYRHIRNLISHEIDADEGDMCSYEDEKWIENFTIELWFKTIRSPSIIKLHFLVLQVNRQQWKLPKSFNIDFPMTIQTNACVNLQDMA